MVQGYYTLQEAAQFLGMSPDELKQMAQKNKIRSFQDRGTWRFRVQDIQELARQRGVGSDLDLILGEAAPVESKGPAAVGPKSSKPKSGLKKGEPASQGPKKETTPPPSKPADAPEVFSFSLDLPEDTVGIGHEKLGGSPAPGKKGPPSSGKKQLSPPPISAAGSDSDVKLVADGSDLQVQITPEVPPPKPSSDSDVKLVGADSGEGAVTGPERAAAPGRKRKSGLAGPKSPPPQQATKVTPAAPDSGVRLVPLDSDSDIRIASPGSDEMAIGEQPPKSSSDSDVRLEPDEPLGRSDEGLLTEEINLDEELRKQEEEGPTKPQAKVKPKTRVPQFPATSPFELSESDLDAPGPAAASEPAAAEEEKPDSSDFELTPVGKTLLGPSTGEDFSLELPDESDLSSSSESPMPQGSPASQRPPSSGDEELSLEPAPSSDEIEYQLDLDAGNTPEPAQVSDSDSEFELSLDVEGSGQLTPDADSSEFELTLDDSGGLAPLEEEAPPQIKADQDKDIFETDFEVPPLEEESDSEVAPLDTDLESSDFDLALDSDVGAEDESGSQVVALDEEEADAGAPTIAADQDEFLEVGEEAPDFEAMTEEEEGGVAVATEEEYAEGPVREVVVEKMLKPAPWGALPVFVMLPCVIVMILVGLMGFELVQTVSGYRQAGFLTKAIGELVGQKIK